MSLKKTAIINDPVHSVMKFGSDPITRKLMKSVIDTNEFQRLRHISQLGLASYVFPGATHTRFSHSIGVLYLAGTVLTHLKERNGVRIGDEYILEVKMSALLHDIGHGPFSHSFEKVLAPLAKRYNFTPPSHEDWTRYFILNDTAITEALKKCDTNLNIDRIASPFHDNKSKENVFPNYLKEIISSQIDVDRMDYLIRDSHFSGVEIGKIDIQYLIHCLSIINHSDNVKTLGITRKGVNSYETYLVARQFMNKMVYFHKKVKVYEYMMELFIQEVIENCDSLSKEFSIPPYLSKVSDLIKSSNNKEDAKPTPFKYSDYIDEYSKLTEDSIWTLITNVTNLKNPCHETLNKTYSLAKKLLIREALPSFEIEYGKEFILDQCLKNKYDGKYEILAVNTMAYRQNKKQNRVFVTNDNETEIVEVSTISNMISLIMDRPETNHILVIVDQDNKIIESIKKIVQDNKLIFEM